MTCHRFGGIVGILVLGSGLVAAQARPVQISVKPGDSPTTIERGRDGMIPVAVLSTAEFDAATIDPTTLRVGPTGTEAVPVRSMLSDVNTDERPDLMLLVRLRDLQVTCDVKAIWVKGETRAGVEIEGSEAVTVAGCGTDEQS